MADLFSEPGSDGGSAAAAGRYARIALERGIDAPETADGLTYACGDVELVIGQRVDVPLGRGNRRTAGIVVATGGPELLGGLPAAKVKAVLGASQARIPPQLIELARWMAEYYVCPLGMVLATMMPAAVKHGVGTRTRTVVERVEGQAAGHGDVKLTPAAKAAWEAARALGAWERLSARELATKLGLRTAAPVNALIRAGLLRETQIQDIKTRAGVMERAETEAVDRPVELTADQARITDGIGATLGSFEVHLLRGVTGSGKTEVYMRVLQRAAELGRTGLVLVPEISLTPQTAGRFIARFSAFGAVAVLHSGLSASERHQQWALAASGRAAVVVGARSAVFAPIQKLGLIIVDEEHATDYKQDQLPRYNGRDVAIKRGQLEACPVLLGSATPSLESWANARTGGRYRLWELRERVGGGAMPRVEIVDMVQERREAGTGRDFVPLSRRLLSGLRETLGSGGQAILLLNRRGYSSYVCCPSPACGWVMRCDDCDASMVVHRASVPAGRLLRCHHCLAEQRVPEQCPLCARRLIALGAGTQRLEEELAARFAGQLESGRSMVRVDGDSMKNVRDYFDVLGRFAEGSVRLLLGTQMIAKGLDFPNVRLVGVIDADTALWLPDFRAAERTFQLVSQVAGRAGRGAAAGRVIVQTMNPEEPAIVCAAEHDYVTFADQELELRRRAGLPPAMRMARVVVRDEDHAAAAARAEQLAALLREALGKGCRMLGPAPCPIARVAGQFRFAVEVLAPRASDLQGALAGLRARGLLKSDAQTAVDVDPVMLM